MKTALPTYKRQRFLLSFIQQASSSVTATDLQKLVFLNTMRSRSEHYQFIPYKFGSYSYQLAQDIEILKKNGFIDVDKLITSKGLIPNFESCMIDSERGDNLIHKAYVQYPYYAINSEIVDRICSKDEVTQINNVRANFKQEAQSLFSLGYEGHSIESFVNFLIKRDIRTLCDVRKNPLSRKFGFSKGKLKHILESIGIKYLHFPELGIESEARTELNSENDYRKLFAEYALTLPNNSNSLQNLYDILVSNKRIALMCYEKDPKMCHRTEIVKYLSANYNITNVTL